MTTIGRAFVAVVPPTPVLDAIEAATGPLHASAPEARWTTRDQRHVTLQFLGDRVDLDAVAEALGHLRDESGSIGFVGGGAFPSERRGRVLWVGVGEGTDLLTRLASNVGALVAPLGYEPDARPYHAHLTLARLKVSTDVRAAVVALDGCAFGPAWEACEVVLFRSHTRRDGAEHEPVARIGLATEDRGGRPVG